MFRFVMGDFSRLNIDDWMRQKEAASYFRLSQTLQGESEVSRRTQMRAVYAAVGVRLLPLESREDFECIVNLPRQDIDDADQQHCIDAAFMGALDALLTHHLHAVRGVRIEIIRFDYDKPQSAQSAFWEAGRDATRAALGIAGGVGMTEAKDRFELIARRAPKSR